MKIQNFEISICLSDDDDGQPVVGARIDGTAAAWWFPGVDIGLTPAQAQQIATELLHYAARARRKTVPA